MEVWTIQENLSWAAVNGVALRTDRVTVEANISSSPGVWCDDDTARS